MIEAPRLLWFFVLNALILTTRPRRKGEEYAAIWNRDMDESPLKTVTRSQAEKLQRSIHDGLLGNAGADVIVDWGMRYGNPSLKSAAERLAVQGCERILFVPLYPQYSAATTATACDKLFEALASMRNQPALRVATPYYDDDVYVDAIVSSLETAFRAPISSRRSCLRRSTACRWIRILRAIPTTGSATERPI